MSDDEDFEAQSDDSGEGGNTMMSLLSSYYGIEEDSKTEEKVAESSSNIDAVGFNHQAYVKNLLCTLEIQDLLREDIKMVHDIKALDSDMQMLVYENYNKFISATETIKKMKTNVEAMDSDMESVKVKMESIAKKTSLIDQSLAAKRAQIDKLVRIKRLLNRLEFLSELPERLEKMIEDEMYGAAIQLYKKTITVLTKQSHVLSFKKIQEKTENMMKDLRVKVLSLFDSPQLEAQQLTQYVAILRMMECSREQVIEKFLAAHKYRSLRMVKIFLRETELAMLQRRKNGSARSSSPATTTSPGYSTGDDGTDILVDPSKVLCVAYVRTFHQSLMVGLIESSKGVREVFSDEERSPDHVNAEEKSATMSLATAYDELQAMISIVMPEYLKCITKVLNEFFGRYDYEYSLLEGGADSGSSLTRTIDGTGQIVIQELEDERAVWIALTRQIILDCQYLDSGTEACRPPECDASLPHADGVAESVLGILDSHFDKAFDKRILTLRTAMLEVVPKLVKFSDCRVELAAELESRENPTARNVLSGRLGNVMGTLEKLMGTFDDVFMSVCKDARLIVDTHAVSRVGISDSSAQLMWRYCDAVCDMVESFGGAAVRPAGANEIYRELVEVTDPTYLAPSNDTQSNMCLLGAVLFTKLLPTLIGRLEIAIKSNDMSVLLTPYIKERCTGRFEGSAMVLLEAFIVYRADVFSDGMAVVMRLDAMTDSRARTELIEARDLTVTSSMIDIAAMADELTMLCSVILCEQPPAPQIRMMGGAGGDSRGGSSHGDVLSSSSGRRGSMAARGPTSFGGGQRTSNYGLQLDIERMFSRKIKVFDRESMTLSLEGIISVVCKAGLKTALEVVRTFTLGPLSCMQLSIDLTFMEEVLTCFVKDSSDIEVLSEEVFSALDSRSPDDSFENEVATIMPRAVNDGLYMASKKCVLLHR